MDTLKDVLLNNINYGETLYKLKLMTLFMPQQDQIETWAKQIFCALKTNAFCRKKF